MHSGDQGVGAQFLAPEAIIVSSTCEGAPLVGHLDSRSLGPAARVPTAHQVDRNPLDWTSQRYQAPEHLAQRLTSDHELPVIWPGTVQLAFLGLDGLKVATRAVRAGGQAQVGAEPRMDGPRDLLGHN